MLCCFTTLLSQSLEFSYLLISLLLHCLCFSDELRNWIQESLFICNVIRPLDGKFKKVMALKWEHKNQILVMNDSQFYCFNVKSVLAKRFENFLSALIVPVCARTFYPSPSPKEIWRDGTIFTQPHPMELAVNISPMVFIFICALK